MQRTKRCHTSRAFAAAVLFAGLACGSARAADAPELKFTQPTRGEIFRFVTLPGSIKANHQATLYAKVPGYLKTLTVDIGDRVRAGQLIAELEVPELEAELGKWRAAVNRAQAEVSVAQAEMAKVKAQLAASEIELKRLREARHKAADLVVPQQVDDATARFEVAKAVQTQTHAAADLARARQAEAQAELQRIERLLAFAKVEAPFNGTITDRQVDPGAFIPAATSGSAARTAALVTLADFDVVRIEVPVPEIEAARVQAGQPVKVTVDSLAGRAFDGKITRQAVALDEATRSLRVQADLPNPQHELRPGMFATAKIGVEQHAHVWLVPVGALLTEKSGASVFLYVDGKAKKSPVKAGFNDGAKVEITGGLSGGERVLVLGKTPPADGQAVNATEAR
ncbi:MAG: efflux RND transporter periplasmic adaptor subunit [Pedosphaera parvula]|nr:efflux RND transporter periplasmic adaptor subunit [Pedosphaera parvula]